MNGRAWLASLALALFVLPAGSVSAQQAGLGVRSGVALNGLGGVDGADARPGTTLGPTYAFALNRWLAIQGELLYSSYGAWLTDAPAVQTPDVRYSAASFRYLQLPVLVRFDVGELLGAPVHSTLYAGPHASYLLSCRVDVTAPASETVPCGASPFADVEALDVGTIAGVAVAANLFDAVQLAADVRYQRGFQRFGLFDGYRRRGWAIAFRLSGTGGGGGAVGQSYVDTAVPPMGIVPQYPAWRGPARTQGIRMD